jgi:hypothetical protein
MQDLSVKNTVSFVKSCLKSEGYSKELITYLLSTYDLESFMKDNSMNKLSMATHLLAHARHIEQAASNY